MVRVLATVAALFFASPAAGLPEEPRGHLVLIGGGDRPDEVMKRIADLAGGPEARLLVVPFAHPEPEAASSDLIEELKLAGAGRAEALAFDEETVDSWETLERVAQASGVFLTGGDQSRLAAALRGTKLLDRVRQLLARGGLVAGTSAGATVLGTSMVIGAAEPNQDPDRAVPAIRAGTVAVEPGLDLLHGTIVDQHFLTRRRQNRLLTAALENPELLAIGIDEATAIVVGPENRFEVLGEGLVTVYDLAVASAVVSDEIGNLSASGIALHLLKTGQAFDLSERRFIP